LTKKQWGLLFTLPIPLLAGLAVMLIAFPNGIPYSNRFNPEVLNGLLALSGIIFAFQPIIFRTKKVWFYRYIFMCAFLWEAILLGQVSYLLVSDSVNLNGTFSGTTFWCATVSLFTNISFLVYFVFADLLVEMDT
jgi:hypothetical protein